MWETKEQAVDVNYNANELWFTGVYGQPVGKPLEIRKWEENTKFFKLLDKTYPRQKADRMLQDLSLIALTYSKQAVQQRLTFKPNSKGENSAPVVFQYDPDGDLVEHVLALRTLAPIALPPLSPIKEAVEDKDGGDASKTFEIETKEEKTTRQQKSMIDVWVDDDDHPVIETDRRPLELYVQLTDDEFLYVQELQRVYDESRCYFSQWILGKETKELVNSARISAEQQGKEFTWAHVRREILKSLIHRRDAHGSFPCTITSEKKEWVNRQTVDLPSHTATRPLRGPQTTRTSDAPGNPLPRAHDRTDVGAGADPV